MSALTVIAGNGAAGARDDRRTGVLISMVVLYADHTVHFGSANGSAGHDYTLLAEGADSAARTHFEGYMS